MKFLLAIALAFLMAAVSRAQTPPQPNPQGNPPNNPQVIPRNMTQSPLSGTVLCGKPEGEHKLLAGDAPDHTLAVERISCKWTKPLEIGELHSKDGVSTIFSEATGNNARIMGYHVTTMDNGDGLFLRYQGQATLKNGALEKEEGRWEFRAGRGKLNGLRGQGTYKCAAAPEGVSCEVEGAYLLPVASRK